MECGDVDESILNISAYKVARKDVINKMNIEEKEDGPSASVVKGNKIIDLSILQDMLNFCSKRGLSEKLYLQCRECKQIVKTFFTSNTSVNNNKNVDINLRSVYGTISADGGLSMLRTFCSSMDLPSPVHPAPYVRYIKHILKSATENCEESMALAAQSLIKEGSTSTEISISVDSTWQIRYGITLCLVQNLFFPLITGVYSITLSRARYVPFAESTQILQKNDLKNTNKYAQ